MVNKKEYFINFYKLVISIDKAVMYFCKKKQNTIVFNIKKKKIFYRRKHDSSFSDVQRICHCSSNST